MSVFIYFLSWMGLYGHACPKPSWLLGSPSGAYNISCCLPEASAVNLTVDIYKYNIYIYIYLYILDPN